MLSRPFTASRRYGHSSSTRMTSLFLACSKRKSRSSVTPPIASGGYPSASEARAIRLATLSRSEVCRHSK